MAGYVTGILDDARSLASYAKKTKSVEMDDVKLAIQMHVEKSFTTPPPREVCSFRCFFPIRDMQTTPPPSEVVRFL